MAEQSKSRMWAKRFLKLLLWMAVAGLGLLLLLYLVVLIFFPPEKLKQIAIDEVASALNRKIEIEDIRLNILRGIEIDGVTLLESDSLRERYPELHPQILSVKHVILKYQLIPLLRRKLVVSEISIDSPEFHLFIDESGRSNLDDLLAAKEVPEPDTASVITESELPISINLKKFDLNNLSFTLDSMQDTTILSLTFASLSGQIRDFNIPKGTESSILEKIRVNATLFMNRARLQTTYISKPDSIGLKLQTDIDFQTDVSVDGIRRIDATGKLALSQSQLNIEFDPEPRFGDVPPIIPELVSMNFQVQADVEHDSVAIHLLESRLGRQLILSGDGSAAAISSEQPKLDFRVRESRVQIDSLLSLAKLLAPAEIRTELDEIEASGTLSFAGTHVAGNPLGHTQADGLQIFSRLNVAGLNLNYAGKLLRLRDLNLKASTDGIYSEAGLADLSVDVSASAPGLNINPDDTLSIVGENLTLSAHSELTEELFPTLAVVDAKIDRIFDSNIDLHLEMNSAGSFDQFEATGNANIFRIHLDKIIPEGIAGIINSELTFSSNSLDRIDVDLAARLDSIMVESVTGWDEFEGFDVNSRMLLRSDKTLANFYLEPSRFTAGGFLAGQLEGEFLEFGEKGFRFDVTKTALNHRNAFIWLPESYKEGIESLDISGETHMTATITGDIPAVGDPNYLIDARVFNDSIDVDFPDAFLSVGDIRTEAKVLITPENLTMRADVDIAEISLADLRKTPIRGTRAMMVAEMPLLEWVDIQACSVHVPDLKSTLTATGRVDSLEADEIELRLRTNFDFSSATPQFMIDDLWLSGNAGADVSIYMKEDLLSTSGTLNLNQLNVQYTDSIELKGIAGDIPFTQKVDIEALKLIDEEIPFESAGRATGIGYHFMRAYYENSTLPMPRVRIAEARFLEYVASNFNIDILIGGGKIEVPGFTMNMFDGNIAGNFGVDLGNETFDDPDLLLDSTTFHLTATLSSLNSAKLNPAISARAEKSTINANMGLLGQGMNPEGKFDMTGYFYITDIGPKVADNLLRLLMPNDAFGIGVVRSLIRSGFKPELMSFEIKHGHFYPKISLSQPWYFPLKIQGQKVELARMPIKLFLAQAMAPAY